MAHPKMFDDDDPVLAKVAELALEMPDAAMKVSHGRPAFYTKKVFAYYGASRRVDDEWIQHPTGLVVQPDPDDREGLLNDPRVFVPAYLGPSGWLGVDLAESSDWSEVAELLDASFRQTATKKLIARLDAPS